MVFLALKDTTIPNSIKTRINKFYSAFIPPKKRAKSVKNTLQEEVIFSKPYIEQTQKNIQTPFITM
jgi:hypothetical protein